ncbi:MAG: sigma-70 family RNA polymerase sigma factor [Solirubrobacteraceae bacterium]|nr:sigma-70 family RNA polymerase sigma factor [Solirubrobacteraceae bacterium]
MTLAVQLAAASSGDRAAWNGLVDRFNRLVWATARGHRLSEADAADVVQTTWLRLVENLDRIQDPERVGAWLATTARRESLRVIAGSSKTILTDEPADIPDARARPDGELLVRERDQLLRRAMGAISERCRTLLRVLAAEPPPSYDEVSAALDMPVGSIGPTRGRCLGRLREELELLGITETS